jgi:hypothetical protein
MTSRLRKIANLFLQCTYSLQGMLLQLEGTTATLAPLAAGDEREPVGQRCHSGVGNSCQTQAYSLRYLKEQQATELDCK